MVECNGCDGARRFAFGTAYTVVRICKGPQCRIAFSGSCLDISR